VAHHWLAHPSLEQPPGAGIPQRLQPRLIRIDDANLLSALPRERLIPADDQDYDQLRAVAEELGMLR
jgi:hypothetical protein